MPRKLSLADLTSARRLYQQDGLSHRAIGERLGVGHTTIRSMLSAAGVVSRPQGWPRRAVRLERRQPAPVEIVRQPGQPLRIPMRSATERRLRRWTEPEREAIRYEIAAGRVERVRRGRSGLPERRSVRQAVAAGVAFHRAMVRLQAA